MRSLGKYILEASASGGCRGDPQASESVVNAGDRRVKMSTEAPVSSHLWISPWNPSCLPSASVTREA